MCSMCIKNIIGTQYEELCKVHVKHIQTPSGCIVFPIERSVAAVLTLIDFCMAFLSSIAIISLVDECWSSVCMSSFFF